MSAGRVCVVIGRCVLAVYVAALHGCADHIKEDQSWPTQWPQWRGPYSNGVAPDSPRLPEQWSETENVAWKILIPGSGWSSPVAWNEHIFVTAVLGDTDINSTNRTGIYLPQGTPERPVQTFRWVLYCIDLSTGKQLWQRTVHEGQVPTSRHPKNSFASHTPAINGSAVFVLVGNIGLFAFDFNGKRLWSRELPTMPDTNGWASASSPAVVGDQIVILHDTDLASYIAVFDSRTGAEIWRRSRREGDSWATPLIWRTEGGTQIVTSGRRSTASYSLSGRLLWHLDPGITHAVIPTPVASSTAVYISAGSPGDGHRPVIAVRSGARGDITSELGRGSGESVAWADRWASSYVPSALVYGGYYYTVFDGGFISCYDATSGTLVYGKTRLRVGATVSASPWAYNGKLFALTEDGTTFVVEAGPRYHLLRSNTLDAFTLASPAIVSDTLVVRSSTHLYAIRLP